jgi:hypothetical protein
MMKRRSRLYRVPAKELNSVLAYAASLMLNGIPPVVCETVINEFYISVRKSISSLINAN